MNAQEFIYIWADGSELSEVGKRHMTEDLNKTIAAAVAAEREACAAIAYSVATEASERSFKIGAQAVAAAIRARSGK